MHEIVGQHPGQLGLLPIQLLEFRHPSPLGLIQGGQLLMGLLQAEASGEHLPRQNQRDHDGKNRPESDSDVQLGGEHPYRSEAQVAEQELGRMPDPKLSDNPG